MKRLNKKGFEMNFAWIFAIIAGIAILFLAIYATSQFIKTRRYEIDAQTSAKLAILLDPLETSLEAGKRSLISFSDETRIYNDRCRDYGNFGSQEIGVSISPGIGEKWQNPAYVEPIHNKYIFSQDIEQSKEFYVFTKPFKMPFKVSDLIFFSGTEYCFVDAPDDIEDELRGLGIRNVNFTNNKQECGEEDEKVCFSNYVGCDISVYDNFDSGYVKKGNKNMYYTGPLIYGAIFSSPEAYECNIKRLMLRLINLCLIYKDKIEILEKKECGSLLDGPLSEMITLSRNLELSQLVIIKDKADEIENINNAAVCRLF